MPVAPRNKHPVGRLFHDAMNLQPIRSFYQDNITSRYAPPLSCADVEKRIWQNHRHHACACNADRCATRCCQRFKQQIEFDMLLRPIRHETERVSHIRSHNGEALRRQTNFADNEAPEFHLLIESARHALRLEPLSSGGGLTVKRAAAMADWGVCLDLAESHAVLPLVGKFVRDCSIDLPEQIQKTLNAKLREHAQKTLALIAELRRILALLEKNRVSALALKGPALSQIVYGFPDLRFFSDLDIYVPHEDRSTAIQCLRDDGYKPLPCVEWYCEAPLRRGTRGPLVDVHWSLSPRYFPARLAGPPRHLCLEMDLCESRIRVLPPPMHLLYLCVHAARHGWESLDQVACIAGFVRSMSVADWIAVWSTAEAAGAKKVLACGLSIVNHVFGIPLDSRAQQLLQANKARLPRLAAQGELKSSSDLLAIHCRLSDTHFRALVYALAVIFLPTEADLESLPTRLIPALLVPKRLIRLLRRHLSGVGQPRLPLSSERMEGCDRT